MSTTLDRSPGSLFGWSAWRPSRTRSLAFVAGPLVAGAWLLAAALPVAADGGPHVADLNSGKSTLTADSCAGCHRAHTAQGAYLITAATEEALCLTCHGSAGVGATTDVVSGIQYKTALEPGSSGQGTDPSVIAGALRGGGFVTARIDSGHATRISYPVSDPEGDLPKADFSSKVPVLAVGQPVTSAHLDLDGSGGVTALHTAWGNGPVSETHSPGPALDLGCTSCHNPHGNGNYRILNSIPSDGSGPLVELALIDAAVVTDRPLPTAGQTRNYTVQVGALLSDVTSGSATSGDYWRRREPWNWVPTYDPTNPLADPDGIVSAPPGGGHANDWPNAVDLSFKGQISAWCSSCHSRYFVSGDGVSVSSGDGVFTYRHAANGSPSCTQCHVAHGTNAVMTATGYSASVPYPDSTTGSASSRLLKVDNRGTCQQCHDPTKTVGFNGVISPAP